MTELAFVRPVDVVSVADRVTDELRNAILSGRLRPGQEFSLRQIAAQLGVSFIPVREALRSLEAEGLLFTRRGRSATVAPLDAEELAGIFRLRRLLEPELAGRAAMLHTSSDLDDLEQTLAELPEPSSKDDWFHEVHHHVHMELLRPATTSWDQRTLKTLVQATTRYLHIGLEQAGESVEGYPEHTKVQLEMIEAFRARSAEDASAVMRRHLDSSERIARFSIPN
ncbi:MAG TPA: GntR family transcriptional regulator [Pseudonocardia sp.]|jgi:DNA-binding GntR family transcriptional regulator|uniref:GntR family transcriptional regulator n=1 Tax=Pseudonocardia sp. TaxID=60912 RepID=UPI002F3E83AA